MTPAAWTTFWAILITAAITGFGILALVVTLRGLQDVRTMLRRMQEQDLASRSKK